MGALRLFLVSKGSHQWLPQLLESVMSASERAGVAH